MSWNPASRAHFFRGICKFTPREDKEVNASHIRDELNASIKRFQKKFTVEDVINEIDVWFKVANASSVQKSSGKEDEIASSPDGSTAEADESDVEPQELTGRAARAYKRRRHSEADEEQDSSPESDPENTQDEKLIASESQESTRSRRASRAARPSMTRNSLSPQRRLRQTLSKVKQEEDSTNQKPMTKSSAGVVGNSRKNRSHKSTDEKDKSVSPQQQISDSEEESEATANSRKQPRAKSQGTGMPTQPSSPKVKRASRRKTDGSNADTHDEESETSKRSQARRHGATAQQETKKPRPAAPKASSNRGRNAIKRQKRK